MQSTKRWMTQNSKLSELLSEMRASGQPARALARFKDPIDRPPTLDRVEMLESQFRDLLTVYDREIELARNRKTSLQNETKELFEKEVDNW